MGNGTPIIRILLADTQALFRQAVRVALESEGDIEVVGEASDGFEAVMEAERTRADVILMDAQLPYSDGIRAAASINERFPDCRVLIMAKDQDESTLVAALEAGASGFMTKDSALVDLIGAARAVNRGDTLIPPAMLGPLVSRLLGRRREESDAVRRISRLTRREREVLALLAEGGDNDRIAQTLVISPETARTHIQNVLGKLGVHSRLEAAAFVMRNGIREELVPTS